MKIGVRLEGGLGDILCANRFVAAIKEKYSKADIIAYIDSEGKMFQKEALSILYPSFYKEIKIIPNKKYKEFWIDCQFGSDNYYGALENIPDIYLKEMMSYDKFYDLHIDSLKWLDYDFDWLRYFKFFPKPEFFTENQRGKYIVLHLISSTSTGHRLENWYLNKLINLLSQNNKCVIISTKDTNVFYDEIKENKNIEIFNGNIKEVCSIISNSSMMLSTDSGFRYIAYGYGIPTLTFSKHSLQPFTAIPSHYIRWLMYPETCFPLNWDYNYIYKICNNILNSNAGYILAPYLENFEYQAVKRVYTINKEKTFA
jgi:hypothetical protein